jgi:hypothetical protein
MNFPFRKNFRLGPMTHAALVAALVVALSAHAEPSRFGVLALSDNKDGDTPQQVFTPETPEIFLRAELVDVPKDTELHATWVAEYTDVGKPEYRIDTTNVVVAADTAYATFSVPKPSTGWPVGTYRVDLAINNTAVEHVHFKVVKQI